MDLGQRVGGHDAVRGRDPVIGAQVLDRGGQSSLDAIHWKRLKNHARGKGQDLLAVDLHQRGERVTGFLRGAHAWLTGARVGVAGVDHQRANRQAAGQVFFTQGDWCGTKAVGGEHAGHRGAGSQSKDGQVAPVGLANAGLGHADLDAGDWEHLIIIGNLQIYGHDRLLVGQSNT